jgi:NhaP-type Na+/H+ or K+/H+ antiporter
VRQYKNQIENATWGIYIFAVVSLLFYVLYLFINHNDFDWVSCIINIILIVIYFCLGAYSNYKPYTAFVATIAVIGSIFLLETFFTGQFNVRGLVIKIILIVYIAMRLKAAKVVQRYEGSDGSRGQDGSKPSDP